MIKLLGVLNQRTKIFCALILFSFLGLNVHAQGGTIPTVGTEFWVGFMKNYSTPNLELMISSETATTGVVSIPAQGWNLNFSVVPGTVTTLTIPSALAYHQNNQTIENKGVLVTTQDTVSVFASNIDPNTTDACRVLPTPSLGTDYFISAYDGLSVSGITLPSEFVIVATENGTEIDITPSVPTLGGNAAGTTFTIQLDEGESYQVQSSSGLDLSGSTVTATAASGDCRPFAVFAGAECTYVPSSCSACDHLVDQLLPIKTWGTNYFLVPFSSTSSYTYRVYARDNATSVIIDGGAPLPLNAGQFLEFNSVSTATEVSANNPILVAQLMEGTTCSGSGDPAIVNLNSDQQGISNITFSTVTSNIITQNFVNLIVESTDIGTVSLDGTIIPPASFNAFPSNITKSYAQLPVATGSHNLSAPNGFNAYLYGTGNAESYAYSVGSFQEEPPSFIDTAYCSNDTVFLAPPVNIFNPEWTTLSDTNTVIGTNNQLILVPPYASDVYIISGSSLVSGCAVDYSYAVASPDSIGITLTASEDTVCMFDNIQMNVTVDSSGSYNYSWSPSYAFDQPNAANPILTAITSGWYSVSVSTVGSVCSSASDSVWIEVEGGSIGKIDLQASPATLCVNDSTQLTADIYQVLYFDDFNGGNDPNLWNTVSGQVNSNICGSLGGDALLFDGVSPREAETVDMNTTQGGEINFALKIANTSGGACDPAEFGEDVLLEYSTNGGTTWTTISTLFTNAYPNFIYTSIPIPAGAQTASTRFRWVQPVFTGVNEDVWALENVSFQLIDNTGFNFTWSNAADLNTPLAISSMAGPADSTWYALEVSQGNCIYSDSILIGVLDFVVDAGPDTSLCFTNGYQMSASTDLNSSIANYSWSNGSFLDDASLLNPIVQQDTTLTYTLTVDNGSCTAVDSATVTLIGAFSTISISDTTICEGDSVTLDLMGFSNIAWTPLNNINNASTTQPTFYPTSDQQYFVSYVNSSGCLINDSIQFFVIALPDVTILNQDTIVCLDEFVQLNTSINSVSNPIYSWASGQTSQSITTNIPGQYEVTVTTGCGTDSDSVLISNYPVIPLNLGNDTTLCVGEDLTLSATIPVNGSALWSDNSTGNALTINNTATAWLELTDSAGCSVRDSIEIDYFPQTNLDLGPDVTICSDQTTVLDASVPQGATYFWTPTNQSTSSINVNLENMYTVNVIDTMGCSVEDSIYVNVNPIPIPTIIGPDEYCITDTVTYALDQTYSQYLWSTNSIISTTQVSGPSSSLSVSVTDINGCIGTDNLNITVSQVSPMQLPRTLYLCDTNEVEVSVFLAGAEDYYWSNGLVGSSVILELGTYYVTGDAICPVTDSIDILKEEVLEFSLGPDRVICSDTSFTISPQFSTEPDSVRWWFDDSSGPTFTYNAPYSLADTIEITASAYRCGEIKDTVVLFVKDCSCPIYVPNTFTPNNDTYNNTFSIGHDCEFETFQFLIFNRWGELLFEAYDPNFVWDGTYGGRVVKDGTYVWKVTYEYLKEGDAKSNPKTSLGTINVLR
jgi:gliding motility-associated-like protein